MITSRKEVELSEHDIPGARLTGATDRYTMSKLTWWLLCHSGSCVTVALVSQWLLCHGVKVLNSWNKQQLISKFSEELYFVYI